MSLTESNAHAVQALATATEPEASQRWHRLKANQHRPAVGKQQDGRRWATDLQRWRAEPRAFMNFIRVSLARAVSLR